MDLIDLQNKVNNWITVVSSWVSNVGKIYFSSTPEDVTVKMVNSSGNVVDTTMPNVAKFRQQVWDDIDNTMSQFSKVFYVDLNGDDTNVGTSTAPFRTLKKAIDSIPLSGNAVIVLNVGVHEITSNITISGNKNIEIKGTGEIQFNANGTSGNFYIEISNLANISLIFSVNNYFQDGIVGTIHNSMAFKVNGNFNIMIGTDLDLSNNNIGSYIYTHHNHVGVLHLNLGTYIDVVLGSLPFFVYQHQNSGTAILDGYGITFDDWTKVFSGVIRDATTGNPINILSNRNLSL